MLEATVVMARCQSSKKPFGITMEKHGGVWKCVWAFATREASAKKEGFDKETVTGAISLTEQYPGCPHCGNDTFCSCGSCKKVFCDGSEDGATVVCPHCGNSGQTEESTDFNLKSGSY
ncbi:MAG: hypothetical protein FWH02_08490 [Oscillospiraceae bacterium]|nr:hypothetical protein [Oscillospiraceae bacterium]